jgi:hypothetical protein
MNCLLGFLADQVTFLSSELKGSTLFDELFLGSIAPCDFEADVHS